MHLNCPHCRNAIEIVEPSAPAEIVCPSCGSSFQIDPCATKQPTTTDQQQKLGRYLLLNRVGMGAFGAVWKARDTKLDRIVAIKVPRAGNVPDGYERDRFLREARSVAQLRHVSIVSVHDVGQEEGTPFIVSDFVEGITLADLLSSPNKRPTFRQAADLIAQLAEALQYAHDQGVVHRDVKPSNVMLESDPQIPQMTQMNSKESAEPAKSADHLLPRLMDFGLAKRDAGEITMTIAGQVLGTPAYMSPEQARGEGNRVDGRSDVYSLGVILYEMLTGQLPFRGNSRMLLHQVLHDEPPPPRSINDRIPRDLQTMCLKAMAKEPRRRFHSAGELADDLRRWLRGEPIQARPVGRVERAWRWCRRNPAVAGLSALVLLLAAGLTLTLIMQEFLAQGNVSNAGVDQEKLAIEPGQAELRGTVVDSEARPVTGARVRMIAILDPIWDETPPWAESTTNSDGSFTFRIQVKREVHYMLEIAARGYKTHWKEVSLDSGYSIPLNLVMKETAMHVAGLVVDENGAPIPDAEVKAELEGGASATFVAMVLTKADGGFEVFDFPEITSTPNTKAAIRIQHSKYAPYCLLDAYTLSSAQRGALRVVLSRGRTLIGRVRNSQLVPVADGMVSVVHRAQGWRAETPTTPSGKFMVGTFELSGLPEGESVVHAVSFAQREYVRQTIVVSADRLDVDLTLRPVRFSQAPDVMSVLGMKLASITPELVELYGLEEKSGVVVVDPGSPRRSLGMKVTPRYELKEGGILSSVGGRKINGVLELMSEILATCEDKDFEGAFGCPVVYLRGEPEDIRQRNTYLPITRKDLKEMRQIVGFPIR